MLNTAIKTLVNGIQADAVGLTDRGFQFGDGVFETMIWHRHRIELQDEHFRRLVRGCETLGITPIPPVEKLHNDILQVCEGLDRAVVRLFVTRGDSPRGYRVPDSIRPNIVAGSYPWPQALAPAYRVTVCTYRMSRQPALAGIKHMNRIEQIMATREVGTRYDEGLVCDLSGLLVSGTMTNVFLVQDGCLITPALHNCGIEGVMRYHILQLAENMNIPYKIHEIPGDQLQQAEEVLLCNSLIGIRPVTRIDKKELDVPGPITRKLITALTESLGRTF